MTPLRRTLRPAPLGLVVLLGLAAAPAVVTAQPAEVIEYYATDALGSLRVVFDAAGTVVARADYAPFGEVAETTGALPAPQFTGYPRDGEAGQDYAVARQYQPRHGRFTTVDPVFAGLFDPQGWNRYAYARNSPLTFVDPMGLQFLRSDDAGNLRGDETVNVVGTLPRPQPPDPGEADLMGWVGAMSLNAGYIGRKRVFTEFEPRGVDRFGGAQLADIGPSLPPDELQEQLERTGETNGNVTDVTGPTLAVASVLATPLSGMLKSALATLAKPALDPKIASTFAGTIRQLTLNRDVTGFRYWGGRSQEVGHWLTTRQTVSQIHSSQDAIRLLNLPPDATARYMTPFIIPRGTTVWVGRVAGGGARATQIYLPNPGGLVPLP